MSYEKFLGREEEAVLAYLGGAHVHARERRVRVAEPRPAIGWVRFVIGGRNARAGGAAEAPDLGALPRVRGHHVRGWITVGTGMERVHLGPEEELPPLAIVRARRWYSSDLVFESLDFDGEVEEAGRHALEAGEALGDLRGASASLRFAHAVALVLSTAERSGMPLSVREALCIVHGGAPRAPIVARRATPRDNPTLDNASERAEIALDGAHARMLSSRRLGNGHLEVAFELMGHRFVSVVDAITLHVYDAGVCLAGADEMVTLDSLPSVIREAIEDDVLVITR